MTDLDKASVSSWSLTIAVPVFNEVLTLRSAIEGLLKVDFPIATEVIVVDDGSTDDSLSTVLDLVGDGRIKILRHKRNLGKGSAIRSAIESATGDIFTILDADLESDPQDLKAILAPILQGQSSVTFGVRTFSSQNAYSFWFVVGNKALALLASLLFDTWISDIETGFKMALIDVWRGLDLRCHGFGTEAEITAKLLKRKESIYEVPISYRSRSRAEGKKIKWTDGVAAALILVAVKIVRHKDWLDRILVRIG